MQRLGQAQLPCTMLNIEAMQMVPGNYGIAQMPELAIPKLDQPLLLAPQPFPYKVLP